MTNLLTFIASSVSHIYALYPVILYLLYQTLGVEGLYVVVAHVHLLQLRNLLHEVQKHLKTLLGKMIVGHNYILQIFISGCKAKQVVELMVFKTDLNKLDVSY